MDHFNKESMRRFESLFTLSDIKQTNEPKATASDLRKLSFPSGISFEGLCDGLRDAVLAFLDYWRYEQTLENMLEEFDESIELYSVDSWINLTLGRNIEDDPLFEEYEAIRTAADNMFHLRERAEERCKMMLRVAFRSQDYQVKIFGRVHNLTDYRIEEFVCALFENICEYDFDFMSGDMDEDCFHFIAFVNDKIDEFYETHK